MYRALLAMLVAALLVTTVAGCANEELGVGEAVASGTPEKGDASGTVNAELSSAVVDFGFELLRRTGGEESRGTNTVVSPLSVHASLAMTYNGAAGTTAEQMEAALGLAGLGLDGANASYANLLASLNESGDGGTTTLDVENSLWADEGFALLPEFAATDREYFGAQLEVLDLQADGPARINEWVSEETNGRITDLLDEAPASAVLYLVNAVYLKGEWETPFPEEGSSDRPFAINGERVDVPGMSRGGEMLYAELNGVQAVRLPYEDGRLGMWVLLPPQVNGDPSGAVDAVLEGLDADAWGELAANATTRPGSLTMPKYTTRTKAELADPLKAMGMPEAFETTADFSGMYAGTEPLYISRVLHETYVSVDETGTEAAAATATEMTLGAALEPPGAEPFEMVVDRPFLFAIDDSVTGAVLFLGRIEDPRE